jgi:hypothetical protein
MNNKITLYTISWNGYWEKYGKNWVENVKSLNTQPDQIYVISDKPLLDCPYDVFICEMKKPWPEAYFRRMAIDKSNCEWLIPSDLDDIMMPNYLDGIDSDYDMIAITIHEHDPNGNLIRQWDSNTDKCKKTWEDLPNPGISDDGGMAYPGISFIKTELYKKYGINKYGFQDLTLHLKLRKDNVKVKTDSEVRYYWISIPNSLSRNKVVWGKKRIESRIIKEFIFEDIKTPLHLKLSETL